MNKPQLSHTSIAEGKPADGKTLWPVNVCKGGG